MTMQTMATGMPTHKMQHKRAAFFAFAAPSTGLRDMSAIYSDEI